MPSIEIQNISKKFQDNLVLDHVNASFSGGRIIGLVGRNGSGKTVLLKMICGLMPVDSGEIRINGIPLGRSGKPVANVGAIIETPGFLPLVSGFRNLSYLAGVRGKIGRKEIERAIEMVGLDPRLHKRVGAYSLGMRQRLGIAQAIMENPEILVLDEPMNSLDDTGVRDMRKLFQQMRDEGKLIIIATHVREDVDTLCDEVYRMQAGKMSIESPVRTV